MAHTSILTTERSSVKLTLAHNRARRIVARMSSVLLGSSLCIRAGCRTYIYSEARAKIELDSFNVGAHAPYDSTPSTVVGLARCQVMAKGGLGRQEAAGPLPDEGMNKCERRWCNRQSTY